MNSFNGISVNKIEIRHYRLVSELSAHIGQITRSVSGDAASAREQVRFVIPSSKDRRWWRQRAHFEQYGPCDSDTLGAVPDTQPWIWEDLYKNICCAQDVLPRKIIAPPERLLILRELLSDAVSQRRKKDKMLLARWPGLGRTSFLNDLAKDIQELLNEAVRPEHLELNVKNANDLDSPSDWLLSDVYSAYLDYLKQNNLLDSSQIWTVANELLIGDPEANLTSAKSFGRDLVLVFTGFMSFTHGQRELLMTLSALCKKIIFLKPEPFLKDFYDIDEQFEDYVFAPDTNFMYRNFDASDPTEHIIEILSSEPALEHEIIARELALWSAAANSDREKISRLASVMPFPGFKNIGIMISKYELESMSAALNRYGVPFTPDQGPLVSQTLPGRVLSSVRNLKTMNFPTSETAMLMTQPCFAGVSFPTDSAIWANRSGLENWEQYLLDEVDRKSASDRETSKTALLAIRAIKNFCDRLAIGGVPADIMNIFYEFLTAEGLWLDRVQDLPLDVPELDSDIRALTGTINQVQKKALALRELAPDIGPIKDKVLKGDDAFEFLITWCRENYLLPPLPRAGSVSVCTGTPPMLASWPVWIMLDTTRKRWQSPFSGSPLLNDTVRDRIVQNHHAKMPDDKDKTRQREALFRRLLLTGESLTIVSRPGTDEKGRPVPETSYVRDFIHDFREHFGLAATDSNDLKIKIDATDLKFLTGSSHYRFEDVDTDPMLEVPRSVPVISNAAGVRNSIAASDLKSFLTCPFQWWLRKQVNLRVRTPGLFQMTRQGDIIHTLFQETWRRLRDEYKICEPENFDFDFDKFPDILNAEWEQMLSVGVDKGPYEQYRHILNDRRFKRRLEIIYTGLQRLSIAQGKILNAIHDAGWRHEKIYLEDEAQLACSIGGVNFTGQCDRIEILSRPSDSKRGQRVAFIADYKRGSGENYDKGLGDFTIGGNGDGESGRKILYGLQLSAYALMFSRSTAKGSKFRNIDLAGVGFLGVKDGKMTGTFAPSLGLDGDNLKDYVTHSKPQSGKNKKSVEAADAFNDEPQDLLVARELEAEFAMDCAAAMLKNGEFRPLYSSSAGAKLSNNTNSPCSYCKFKGICRKEEFRRSRFILDQDPDIELDQDLDFDDNY